jgi:RHS repeat-associated protein
MTQENKNVTSSGMFTTQWAYISGYQGGRLQQIKSGVYATPDSLQDLRYTYDRVGNVLTISDYKAGSPQTQTFTYDNLKRLTSAVASGGTGGTYALENYNYDGTTGNLASKAGVSYTYSASVACTGGNRTIPHAVSAAGSNSYAYDCNGNQVTRIISGSTYSLTYDAENRMTTVSGGTTASFVYDGDGKRVKGTSGGVTTTYIGNYYEWTGSTGTMVRYYYDGATRVAVRTGSTLNWLFGDHLGSSSRAANSDGSALTNGEQRYKPWGEKRFPTGDSAIPTTFKFTGQRQDSYINLYWYGSRWYDSSLGRFVSPDTVIPVQSQGVQAWDRYAYANNNAVRFNDPTGHRISCGDGEVGACGGDNINNSAQVIEKILAGQKLRWDQLTIAYQDILRKAGWTPESYNREFVTGNVTDISGTFQDPAVYISIAITGGVTGLWKTLGQAAVAACLAMPNCSSIILSIQPFNEMPVESGFQRHHLLDVRFARMLGIDPSIIPSVYLTPEQHQLFTNLSRAAIPYGTRNADVDAVWGEMQRIYADFPTYLEAIRQFLINQGIPIS